MELHPQQYLRFLGQPIFERLLVEDGTIVLKYWFSVSDREQEGRSHSRQNDPMRGWKLPTIDVLSIIKSDVPHFSGRYGPREVRNVR